jgi:hypothetical protein
MERVSGALGWKQATRPFSAEVDRGIALGISATVSKPYICGYYQTASDGL